MTKINSIDDLRGLNLVNLTTKVIKFTIDDIKITLTEFALPTKQVPHVISFDTERVEVVLDGNNATERFMTKIHKKKKLVNIPKRKEGVHFIVYKAVAEALPEREDFISLDDILSIK